MKHANGSNEDDVDGKFCKVCFERDGLLVNKAAVIKTELSTQQVVCAACLERQQTTRVTCRTFLSRSRLLNSIPAPDRF